MALVRKRYLDPYVKASVIAQRAIQIAGGAPHLEMHGITDPLVLAEEELKNGLIDMYVARKTPDGRTVRVHVREFSIMN